MTQQSAMLFFQNGGMWVESCVPIIYEEIIIFISCLQHSRIVTDWNGKDSMSKYRNYGQDGKLRRHVE